ncbi:DNA polymerase III subunit alpha [Arthrobacter crystallopoietes BAB-32]|uniref:DNA polymerase III subunit alpha n=1 Tax=Arthrobacter crystallopoietes BAB-32 TaxID=1246476 RepID=N1UWA6_9MICC|nr:DNA polymerase III subunit epsilon [Arthrobacter crystallopoietes]EMY34681.1 DNA polymerase III subunit alpha [Arthrobacter crystallopoietes BAB-32]
MGIEFTAIDFETANGFRGSPCSVGLSKVRDGKVVEEASWLMRPPEGFDHFDPRNVQIHGITAGMVADQPRFCDVFPEIAGFIGADLLVAHNAAFDLGVIRSALEVSELAGPAYDYACTVILSRRSYSLVSYSLPFVAEAAGVPLQNHHDAVEDARACAGIMIDIARRREASSVAELMLGLQLNPSRLQEYVPGRDGLSKPTVAARERLQLSAAGGAAPQTAWTYWPQEGSNPPANPQADAAHPLYGQTVVFTGNLGIERQQAKIRAAALGAQPASSVTRKTTVLVVGDGFVAADLKRGRLTAKAQKVLQLHGRGQQIEVLSEGEFLQMLGGDWPAASV